MSWSRRALLATAFSLGATTAARIAFADEAVECVRETERAQVVRDDGKFLEARDLFRACAREECPRPVRKDCADFAAELETRMPTIVPSARDERGTDIAQLRVTVDDKPLPPDAVARAVPVDPGPHRIRFEASGRQTVVSDVVVREGEKNRFVEAVLVPTQRESPKPAPSRESSVPTMTWILGGVAVAGGATYGVLSLLAVGDAKDLERSCSPRCTDDEIAPVQTKFTVARVAGGVAIGALAGALLFYLLKN